MYIPTAFAETRIDVLQNVIRDFPFATLITTTEAPLPTISHLPLILDSRRSENGVVIGHLARVNPHAAALSQGRPTVAVFHGPHAYVSPAWYRTSPAVPTWNYVAVHASGVPQVVADPMRVREILLQTTAAFEAPDSSYQAADLPATFLATMAQAVVAFEMPIDRIEGKFKLSQNRSAADQEAVFATLNGGDAMGKAIANLMPKRPART
ncbi:FMN-binding negative transcriptional regulator [Humisphaera borealis]|uniref:FMN-binding negative transcriptional regulator n=1 Tax=Humisphaera borealis TaxID=2807512 RepID=A0A7M2X3V7_9BACT|nr:FMN-binding negative transcriptional regulator [Humisphaera borealis]QOV91450.1 FMN-binding negative transcriptional regulator [Humisphaera borealis]